MHGPSLGFVDERTNAFPRQLLAFVVDGTSIIIGSLLGCAPLTTYIESASGIREGGRTGLTAIVVRDERMACLPGLPLVASAELVQGLARPRPAHCLV